MKKFLMVLFLLPMFLVATETTLTHDYFVSEYYSYIKGDTSGVAGTKAAAVDTFYILNINIGKYTTATLFLLGNIDSMIIYNRTAPISAYLSSFEWDSLYETAATDSVLAYDFTGLNSSDYMDIMIISSKADTVYFTWFYSLLK